MLRINDDNSIHVTRGDTFSVKVRLKDNSGQEAYLEYGDQIRFTVYGKNNAKTVYLEKIFTYKEYEQHASYTLTFDSEDTKFDDIINKPKDYWYEVEFIHEEDGKTVVQTIIGYDDNGAKIFRLYPESGNDE
jgi:hypothetical protein